MGSWAALSLFFLWTLPVKAEVLNQASFANTDCAGFFYKATEPSGFDNNLVRICQDWRADHNPDLRARFPTLHDTSNRIPIWSAYQLFTDSSARGQKPPSDWYIEPQLVDTALDSKMQKEGEIPEDQRHALGEHQALSVDYRDSYFDRGHLFPNSFQYTNTRLSTFTLTNAVPMDPCFNRVKWAKLEEKLKAKLLGQCVNKGGTPYLLTGSVPDPNRKIPVRDDDDPQLASRVSVPSHVWTAACCDHVIEAEKFTLAFLGENRDDGTLEGSTVVALELELKTRYGSLQDIKLFVDSCGDINNRVGITISSEIEQEVMSGNVRLDMAAERKRKGAHDIAQWSNTKSKKVAVSTLANFALKFTNYQHFLEYFNSAPGFYCELTSQGNDQISGPVCAAKTGPFCIVKERAPLPAPASGGRCVDGGCKNSYYNEYSWCTTEYTTPGWDYCCTEGCKYDEYSKSYKCQSSKYGKVPCSPQYSSVTEKGEACLSNHPCATYRKDYYWCYIDFKGNWDYCCAPKPETPPFTYDELY